MRALDLFCGAGGATRGLQRAGYHVTGVDWNPQPAYCGDAFIQADVIEQDWDGYDLVWASPPCQVHSITAALHRGRERSHLDLIPETRDRLRRLRCPWVMENVVGAPLIDPQMLCGTMFGLRVYRHRQFETSFAWSPPAHGPHTQGSTGSHRGYSRAHPMVCVAGHNFELHQGKAAMGIDWVTTRAQLAQAIPPAYSEYIARQARRK